MKPVQLSFVAEELSSIASALEEQIESGPPGANEPGRRALLGLYLRILGASVLAGSFADFTVIKVPWVIPTIQKAIAGAEQIPALTRQVEELQAKLKDARKKPGKAKKTAAAPVTTADLLGGGNVAGAVPEGAFPYTHPPNPTADG